MLTSLIKFEWKSMARYLWIVWAGLLACSLLLAVTYRGYDILLSGADTPLIYVMLKVIPTIAFWLLFTANIIITIVMVVARFYSGLLCEEGYLMHTLPVKTRNLILSKGIIATAAVIISIIAALLSVYIMSVLGMGASTGDLKYLFRDMCDLGGWAFVADVELFLIFVLAIMAEIYKAYTAMSLGQLAGKHRILLSAGAYIGVNIALSIIMAVLIFVCEIIFVHTTFDFEINFAAGSESLYTLFCLALILGQLIECGLLHLITEKLLTKKLNLV
ncbi:MAG: hypothetical protein PUB09_06220 [Firmicutes bacterium]|nr:hypothetical protein [Bacillota bacterium]